MPVLIVITLVSLAVAAATSRIAWRVVREERRRSAARVAALAAEIRSPAVDRLPDAAVEGGGRLFTFTPPVSSLSRLPAVVIAGALVVGVGAVLLVGLDRVPAAARPAESELGAVRSPQVAALPADRTLELVALGHERDHDQLIVRGIVRNPANGSPMTQLTAVVLLYDRDGRFLTTGRAVVQAPRLEPGHETTFLVTMPDAARVVRYRVSFRSEDRVIPHVDTRS